MKSPQDLIPYFEEQDVHQPSREWDMPQIEMGTIGWEDEDIYYEKGTDSNDGMLLVRVQLYRGRDIGKDIKSGVGQGHKLLCVMSTIFGHRIPKKGTRCYVCIPFGFQGAHGTACIFALAEKNPTFQFDGTAEAADGVPRMMIGSDDMHIVIRGKSVTLTDPNNLFFLVGTNPHGGDPSIVAQDNDGAGFMISQGSVGIFASDGQVGQAILQMGNDGAIQLVSKNGGALSMDTSGDAHLIAGNAYIMGAGIYLGLGATAAAAVGYKPPGSGPGPVVNASATVYVSP